jgi:hypothetical protein
MVAQVREEVRQRKKDIMQRLMTEERELFLGEHPEDKGNGCLRALPAHLKRVHRGLESAQNAFLRVLPRPPTGKEEGLRGSGRLRPFHVLLRLNTRKMKQAIETIYGAFCSHAS